jgi:hypothetical protein
MVTAIELFSQKSLCCCWGILSKNHNTKVLQTYFKKTVEEFF